MEIEVTGLEQYWKPKDSRLIFVNEFIDYSNLFHQNPRTNFYLSCKLAYDYYKYLYTNTFFLGHYLDKNIIKDESNVFRTNNLLVRETDDWKSVYQAILMSRPKKVIYYQEEVCAYHIHSELTEIEFICMVFGIEFYRTSEILDFILGK